MLKHFPRKNALQFIPNTKKNLQFGLRESCRQIDDRKVGSIKKIQLTLRSSIFGALTQPNCRFFLVFGIMSFLLGFSPIILQAASPDQSIGTCGEGIQGCKGSLPSARRCLENEYASPRWGGGISLTFLMWQPREDTLEFALKEGGKRSGVNFSWSPGFKLDFDLQFPNRSWDLDVRWTAFYNRSEGSYSEKVVPLWFLPTAYPSFDSSISYGEARGIWKSHFNGFDLELGYDPLLTKNLGFRLNAGVKAFSLFQHLTIHYRQGIIVQPSGSMAIPSSQCGLRTESLGIGPRIGFNSSWRLPRGWSLVGDFSGTLALDYFVIKRKDSDNVPGPLNVRGVFREHFYAFHPVLEAILGFGWEGCFGAKNGMGVNIQAAYEIQTYWEQNMVRQVVAQEISFQQFSMRSDYAVQGVSLKVSVGF